VVVGKLVSKIYPVKNILVANIPNFSLLNFVLSLFLLFTFTLRYKTEKVWDKASRLDLIFGSTTSLDTTTSGPTIHTLMEAVDQQVKEAARAAIEAGGAEDSCSDSEETDNDDEGLTISLRPSTSGTKAAVDKFLAEPRSTHFLAIRITDPALVGRLVAVQDAIVAAEPVLSEAVMRPGLFHITLAMLRLEGIAGIQAAVDAVESFPSTDWPALRRARRCDGVDDVDQPPVLDIGRLNHFGHRVVYAEVRPRDPHLFDDLVGALRTRLEAAGGGEGGTVSITNNFDFVPHLTLAKVSRPMTRMRRSKYIDESYYAAHVEEEFGQQLVDNLQLCIFEAATRYDGFYMTLSQVQL
jgi:hypothetical protein